jgi:glycosyltransferase involved in cell wall biosynthesis
MTLGKLKIGISIWSFAPNTGGLQAHAQCLCQHLQRRGHEVVVVTRSATKIPTGADYLFFNEPHDDISVEGIPVRPLRLSKLWSPVLWLILKLAARPAWAGLAAWLFERVAARPARAAFAGFDVVHHVGHATALVGFAAAKSAKYHRVPFLVQPTAHPLNFGDSSLDFRLYRQADRLLVHTNYEREFFRARGITASMDVVYNGIEDRVDGRGERFRERHGTTGPLVLYLGRKAVDKGYPLVVEAFQKVRSEIPEAVLVCIGPVSLDAEVKPAPGVVELNFVSEDEKHDALAACTCLCVPSEGESFGLVYMEAGRYRKPVIGRKLPVLEELLGSANAALLLGRTERSQNRAALTAAELAGGIRQLIKSPSSAREIGEACHRVSEAYLWPRVVIGFEQSYYATLGPGRAGDHVS